LSVTCFWLVGFSVIKFVSDLFLIGWFLCDIVCQWLVSNWLVSLCTFVSSPAKTEILKYFQQYFSYMAVSFIGGGNWNTRRKPPTCRKNNSIVVLKLSLLKHHHAVTATWLCLALDLFVAAIIYLSYFDWFIYSKCRMVQYVVLKLPDHHALSFICFNIIIFSDQLDIKYVRGTGPGGQHVNTSLY